MSFKALIFTKCPTETQSCHAQGTWSNSPQHTAGTQLELKPTHQRRSCTAFVAACAQCRVVGRSSAESSDSYHAGPAGRACSHLSEDKKRQAWLWLLSSPRWAFPETPAPPLSGTCRPEHDVWTYGSLLKHRTSTDEWNWASAQFCGTSAFYFCSCFRYCVYYVTRVTLQITCCQIKNKQKRRR